MKHYNKMTTTTLLSLLLLLNLSTIRSYTAVESHIQTKTATLDFSNAGYMSKVGFPFKLATPLLSTEYIKLLFPFPLHCQTMAAHPKYSQLNPPSTSLVIAKDVSVTWNSGDSDNGCAKTSDQQLGSIFTWDSGSKEYFVQFLDSNYGRVELQNGTWYTIWINFTDPTVLNNQLKETILTVGMQTVSSIEKYPQIYDENPAFAFFKLEKAPKKSLDVLAFYNNAENTFKQQGNHQLEETNCIIIDIQAQAPIDNGAKIIYKMTDNAFLFINNCTSEEKSTIPTISKLTANFSCTIDTAMNALIVELNQGLEQNARLRIQTYTKNPNFLTKSAIEVRTMKRYLPLIIETGRSSSDVLYTNPIELLKHNINLGWNLNLDRSVADLPIKLKVIRGESQDANYCPYNSFRVNFQVKTTTPTGIHLKLVMKIEANSVNSEQPDILSGSLSENLPKPTNDGPNVQCKIYNRTDGLNRKIICTNIGQLIANQEYHLGFKMYFPFDIGTEDIDLEQFGTLEIFSYNEYLLDYNNEALIKLSRPNNAQKIQTQNSMNWQQTNTGSDENIIISTQSGASYTIAERGIHLSSSPQRLFLSLNAAYNELTNQTSITTGTGLRILMNPIFTGTSVLTPKQTTAGTAFSVTATFEISTTVSESTYSLLQFYSSSDTTLKDAFPTTRAEKQISFDSISVNTPSSMFVDQQTYDFYLVTYDRITEDVSQATAGNYALINSYCMTPFNNLVATVSNFWTSDGNNIQETLTGNYIPVVLRISGSLLSSESSDVNSFAVFFDNFDFFSLSDLASQKTVIDANSSRNNHINSTSSLFYAYGHTKEFIPAFFSMSRVEFNLSQPQSSFQVVIPLKTRVNQSCIYLAAMKDHPDYSGKTYKMITMLHKSATYDLTASATSLSPPLLNAATSPDYGLDGAGKECGVASTVTLKAGHTGGAVGSGGSAGFTYVLSRTESFLEWRSATTSFTGSCLGFKYYYTDSSIPANNEYKYGVFCSLDSGAISSATAIQLYSLKVPYETGIKLLGYGGYSKSDGSLYTLQQESHKIGSSNTFTFNSITPSSLVKGEKNRRLVMNFTTENAIQEGAVIQLRFMQSVNFISNEDSKCMIKLANESEFLNLVCAVSTPSATQVRYEITGLSGNLQPNTYLLYHYGVDNLESEGKNTSVIIEIISRNDNDAEFISDRSSGRNFQYINDESQVQEKIHKLALNISAGTTNKKATSVLDLQIQAINAEIYHNSQLLINLGQVASDNQNNYNLQCQVLNSSKLVSNQWKVVNQVSLDRIKLQLKEDLEVENSTLYLRCLHTILPFTQISTTNLEKAKKITASLILPSSERVLYSSESIEFLPSENDTSLGGGNLLLKQKLGNTYGSINSLTFSLQIPTDHCSLNSSSQLIITFPYYYPPGISSTGDLFCRVNDVIVKCEIIRSRAIRINNLVNINQTNQDFEVSISGGVMGEIMSTQLLSGFWIGVVQDYNSGEQFFCAQGLITDNSAEGSQKEVSALPIESMLRNGSFIREDRGLTFSLYLENALQKEDLIVVRPAGLKEGGIQSSIGACELNQAGENVASSCKVVDGSIRMQLIRGVDPEQWVQAKIDGWRVQDSSICLQNSNQVLSVEIIRTDGRVIASSQNMVNTQLEIISRNPERKQLGARWKENGKNIDEIHIIRGIYSPPITLYALQDSGFFGNEVSMQSISDNFTLFPEDLKLVLGSDGMQVQIAMKQQMEINHYLLGMQFVNDRKHYYENLELIKIKLYNTVKLIQLVQQTQFDIPLNSTSTFIELNLQDYELPESNLVVQLVLAKYTSGINIYPRKCTLNASLPNCQIKASCDTNRAKLNDQNFITLLLSGDNSDSYSLQNSLIKLTVIDQLQTYPNATLEKSQLSTVFDIYEVQPGVFYYQLFVEGYQCHELNQSEIINEVDLHYQLDPNTTCQQQFQRVVIHKPKTTQSIKISPILANLNYKFRGFCVNSKDNCGPIQELSFASDNNQGQVVKVKLEFDVSQIKIVTLDEVRMCCFFANYFKLPVETVQSPFNTYCYSDDFNYRRQLLEYHDSFNKTSSEQTIITQQQNLTFLFLPAYSRLKDLSYLQVQSLIEPAIEEMRSKVEGLPPIVKLYDPIEINQLIEVKEPSFEIVGNEEWIALLGIQGQQDGYIYASLYQNNQSNATFDPIPAFEIKQGRSYKYGYPVANAKYHYENGATEVITHNFTELSVNTSYELFVVATREDLSLWPSFSNVLQYQVRTNITMGCCLLVAKLGAMIFIMALNFMVDQF